MRAMTMTNWTLTVEDLPDLRPGPGQVLTEVLACGICGSDLHMRLHGPVQMALRDELADDAEPDPARAVPFVPERPMVMGHEFCCRVVEPGPGVVGLSPGDVVVSMPGIADAAGVHALGYSNAYPGGYGEQMLLLGPLARRVPNGLSPEIAALTEPLAVGVRAVAKSRIVPGESAVVLGCGPVGLAVIAALRRAGIGPIVASDFSPTRRRLAETMGADVVVDPRDTPPVVAWRAAAPSRPDLVVFEAVGVPGLLEQAMRLAPRNGRVVVVGVCMETDRLRPMIGIGKELNVQFVLAYTAEEFDASLRMLADGEVAFPAIVTGRVGIDGVPAAFDALADPEAHAKILVVPGAPASLA
jgi:threonine dehydrogenase-like Zn-dependent dehydrogenase